MHKGVNDDYTFMEKSRNGSERRYFSVLWRMTLSKCGFAGYSKEIDGCSTVVADLRARSNHGIEKILSLSYLHLDTSYQNHIW
jgi:hypothetical protein